MRAGALNNLWPTRKSRVISSAKAGSPRRRHLSQKPRSSFIHSVVVFLFLFSFGLDLVAHAVSPIAPISTHHTEHVVLGGHQHGYGEPDHTPLDDHGPVHDFHDQSHHLLVKSTRHDRVQFVSLSTAALLPSISTNLSPLSFSSHINNARRHLTSSVDAHLRTTVLII